MAQVQCFAVTDLDFPRCPIYMYIIACTHSVHTYSKKTQHMYVAIPTASPVSVSLDTQKHHTFVMWHHLKVVYTSDCSTHPPLRHTRHTRTPRGSCALFRIIIHPTMAAASWRLLSALPSRMYASAGVHLYSKVCVRSGLHDLLQHECRRPAGAWTLGLASNCER